MDESRTEELVAENRRLSEELARLEKEKESEPVSPSALRPSHQESPRAWALCLHHRGLLRSLQPLWPWAHVL